MIHCARFPTKFCSYVSCLSAMLAAVLHETEPSTFNCEWCCIRSWYCEMPSLHSSDNLFPRKSKGSLCTKWDTKGVHVIVQSNSTSLFYVVYCKPRFWLIYHSFFCTISKQIRNNFKRVNANNESLNSIASAVRKLQKCIRSLHRQGAFIVSHELVSKGKHCEH